MKAAVTHSPMRAATGERQPVAATGPGRGLGPGRFRLVNFAIFQLIWVIAIVYQEAATAFCVLLLLLHFLLSPTPWLDFRSSACGIAIGVMLDYALMESGVYRFSAGEFPLWLACIWIAFVLSLRHSLAWLAPRPWFVQALLGSVCGTLSYLSGARLGAVSFGLPLLPTLVVLACVWAIMVPALFYLIERMSCDEKTA